ncbi:MAG: radical SAM protein [Rhodovibrio sp.]|nr:radical SAM protein [Rhodovibrio sp.]
MDAAPAARRIDRLGAPLFVSWQLTRDCDLACVHCCTESAPGKPMAGELSRAEALALADEIVDAGVPYVMLCGGEPMVVPHFMDVADRLGRGGVQLKIETNGQRFGPEEAARLADLPVRSVQISLDADDPATYARQRPGASLDKVHDACRGGASGRPAAGGHLRANPDHHRRAAGGDRPGAAPGRLPLQHGRVDAHRQRRAELA